jgi:hypothetical protein
VKIATLLLVVGILGLAPFLVRLAHAGGPPPAVETYWSTGALKARIETEDGTPHGACVRFYADGAKEAEGRFADGELEGPWTFWTPDGRIDPARSGTYRVGRLAAN